MKKTRVFIILTIFLSLSAVSIALAGSSYTASPGQYNLCDDPNGVNLVPNDYVMIDYISADEIRFTSVWDAIYSMRDVTGTYNSIDNCYYFTYFVPGRQSDRICGYLWIDNDWLHLELSNIDNPDLYYVLQEMNYTSTTYRYNEDGRANYDFCEHATTQSQSANYSQSSNNNSQGGYALAIQKLATRTGPGTQYDEPGTFNVAGQWIHILAKHYDVNDVCWVKCEIPTSNGTIIAWTGWKRFDHSTLDINSVPTN